MAYGDSDAPPPSRHWLIAVVGMLITQLGLLWISLDVGIISIFCTAGGSTLASVFGIIHVFYLLMLCFGIVALFKPNWRRFYVIAVGVALVALPIQAVLVEKNMIGCDSL